MFLIRWIIGMPMAALVTAGLFFMMAQLIRDRNEGLPPSKPDLILKITPQTKETDPYEIKPPTQILQKAPPETDFEFQKTSRAPIGPRVTPERAPIEKTPPGQKTLFGPTIKVPPAYPEGCRSRGVEGVVIVEFDVSPEGNVINPRISSSPNGCFNRTVLKAISGWKYPPAANGGMRYGVIERFNFQLQE